MSEVDPTLAAEFAALAPWVFQFRIDGADYGGNISALGDARLAQFWQFAPEARRILELGSLEGAHTVHLAARPGVEQVVAIEGRAANLRKAELIRRLFGAGNVELVQANLEETDLQQFGHFDAVFCSGLLYHLPEPWKLLTQLPRLAPELFVWTHYAHELQAKEIRNGLRGRIHTEGGPDEPLSGMSNTAFWPTLGSLLQLVTNSGYHTITIIHNDVQHQHGGAVTFFASTSDLPLA